MIDPREETGCLFPGCEGDAPGGTAYCRECKACVRPIDTTDEIPTLDARPRV
ncbi:hypothetical protein [Natronococcus roseus]|uniref:hypothetical protein n=1 Tax=Natronococcus roseus TaxID=1052014 RepID=UPI00374CD3A4